MSHGRSALRRILSSVFFLGVASTAHAQETTPVAPFSVERLELNPSAADSLSVSGGRLLARHGFRVALGLHYESNPLILTLGDEKVGAVIADRFTGHLLAAWAPFERFELGLAMPVVQYQKGDDLTASGISAAAEWGIGDPVLSGRAGFLQQRLGDPLDLALQLGVGFPAGTEAALASDRQVTFFPKLMIGHNFDPIAIGVEAGMLFRQNVAIGPDTLGNQVSVGAVLAAHVTEQLRLEVEGRSHLSLSGLPTSYEVLGGAAIDLGMVDLFALGGPGIGTAPGTPAYRVMVGLGLSGEPEPVVEPPAPTPPPMPVDPCSAGESHRPEQCPDLDDDGDGIANATDRCPLEKGPASEQGCPVQDKDGDGVRDADDKCPEQPGPAERAGCPIKDQDNDGVPDEKDNCPTEAGPESNQGCPEAKKQLVVITATKLEIKEKVYFDTAKAKIQPRSFTLLDQVASILNSHPELSSVTVEGHTDDRGSAATNRKLSQARAESVRAYLIGKSVDPSRLKAEGFGPDRPAASNTTADGRELNRRVEFKLPEAAPAP